MRSWAPDDILYFPPYKGAQDPTYTFRVGGRVRPLSGGLGAERRAPEATSSSHHRAEEFFSAEPPFEELPVTASVLFAIERTVVPPSDPPIAEVK